MASSPPPRPTVISSPGLVTAIDSPIGPPASPAHPSPIPALYSDELIPEAVVQIDSSLSRSSIASTVSFDGGFRTQVRVTDRLESDVGRTDRYESQNQQSQHTAGQAEVQDESQGVRELERQLERWVGQCPLCVINKGGQGGRHSMGECRQEHAGRIRRDWMDMVKGMRPGNGKAGKFAPYSCCFTCYAPQAVCQGWEPKEGQSGKWKATGKGCQFKDIIMPVVVCMLCEEGWAEDKFTRWATAAEINVRDQEEVYQWLGEKVEWGSIEVSRLVQVFYKFEKGRESR
jgi:hypothetical protein